MYLTVSPVAISIQAMIVRTKSTLFISNPICPRTHPVSLRVFRNPEDLTSLQWLLLPGSRRPPTLFFYLSEKVQLPSFRSVIGEFLAGRACLHGIHTHSVSPNKGDNHKDLELWELTPSRRCLAGWAANAAGNTRGAKQCQTLPQEVQRY